MSDKIAVIGAGAWGLALASIYDATVFTRNSAHQANNSKFRLTTSLVDITDKEIIFLVTPASTVRNICQSLIGKIKAGTTLILCSKGMEREGGELFSDAVQSLLPNNQVAVLSGPNFAHEISAGLPAISSIACSSLARAMDLAKILSRPNFNLYPSDDMVGLQICGALKNVLAILSGIVIGYNLGENFRAAILALGIKEISQIIQAKNGKIATILEPGGVGDIFLTCNSGQSRNTSLGIKIAQSGKFTQDLVNANIEGVYTINALQVWLKELELALPLLALASQIINDKVSVSKKMIEKLLIDYDKA